MRCLHAVGGVVEMNKIQRAAEITEETWRQRAMGEDSSECGWCQFAKSPSATRSYCVASCPIPAVFGDSCLHLELFDLWRCAGVGSIAEQDAATRIYDALRTHQRELIAAAERIEARK